MRYLVIFPIILPLAFAILSLFFWKRVYVLRRLGLAGTVFQFLAAALLFVSVRQNGILVMQAGNWPAPFGITLAIDLFGAVMIALSSLVALLIAVYSQAGLDAEKINFGFYPLFFILLMGVNGAFSTGDLFNLYVWFEVMLMASFVLMALGNTRAQLEGAIKYVILNLIASMIFLTAAGLTYSLAGTLNMADLAIQFGQIENTGLVSVLAVMYLAAFGIKSAIFPFFFWLPASYHTPPVVVTALFSGLLTKVGIFSMVRVFTLVFAGVMDVLSPILLVLAAITMVTGVLGAAAQWDIRRLLSFHIVSQIGYLVMGLGLATQLALAGVIYFMVHVVLAKTALFLVAGVMNQITGTYDLKKMGGLYQKYPRLALLFGLPALALAGLPPFSGFFAKLLLVQAGLAVNQGLLVAVSLVVSLLTLFSMSKIWLEGFWKPAPGSLPQKKISAWLWAPVVFLAAASILMGIASQPFIAVSQAGAAQLLDAAVYIRTVLE